MDPYSHSDMLWAVVLTVTTVLLWAVMKLLSGVN
jgi:hypothetical protein